MQRGKGSGRRLEHLAAQLREKKGEDVFFARRKGKDIFHTGKGESFDMPYWKLGRASKPMDTAVTRNRGRKKEVGFYYL